MHCRCGAPAIEQPGSIWDAALGTHEWKCENGHFFNTPKDQSVQAKQQKKGSNTMGFFKDFSKLMGTAPGDILPTSSTPDPNSVEADYTVKSDKPQVGKLVTSNMSQDELRTRRTNLIEGSKFGRPAHENIMLFFLKIWLWVGPVAFVALTTAEVAYILTQLVPEHDAHGQYVIWGGALFIDLAMMFTTFGVAIKRRDLAEKRELGTVTKREEAETWFGTLLWLIFAIINIISQAAFLHNVITAGDNPDANMWLLFVFVGARVVGFILGDASTAFFLANVESNDLKLIARAEREKGTIYADIARAEGDRKLIETKAEADMRILQIEVQQREQEADFMAALKRQMFTEILSRRGPAPGAELSEGNNRSKMRRLDSGT